MLKYFRKIRQKLIYTGKIRRYLTYAIGEIILVVIGILIALQINNWNESKKNFNVENQALIDLKFEFDDNQERFDYILDRNQKNEKVCRDFLMTISDKTKSLSQKLSAETPNTNRMTWGVTNTVLTSLVNSGDINKIQNDSLKLLLMRWPIVMDRYTEVENRLLKTIDRYESQRDAFMPRSIVREGDHSTVWPGNFIPEGVSDKLVQIQEMMINDRQFFNAVSELLEVLYITQIIGTEIRIKYQKISQMIVEELKNRNIHLISE